MSKIRKILLGGCVFFGLCFPIFAHPLDISSSTFTIRGNTISAVTFFHSYQAEKLLRSRGINTNSVTEYYKHKEIFTDYVSNQIHMIADGAPCVVHTGELIEKEAYELISEGLGIEYSFSCNHTIDTLTMEVLFFHNEPLQTNRIYIYDANSSSNTSPVAYKVLNPAIYSYTHSLSSKHIPPLRDTDGDNIPDEEEYIYQTDPQKSDTDGDNYSDYEEVTLGWNPRNSELGPGQKYRETPLDTPFVLPTGLPQAQEDEYNRRYMKDTNLLDTGYGNERLKDTLKAITNASKNINIASFSLVFFLVMTLGFVHALGPGHSKSLLVSYVLDRDRGFFQGLGFISVFTITHLLDIILLFLVTKLLFAFYDPTQYMIYIQRASIIVLFFFSLYMFIRAVRALKAQHTTAVSVNNSLRGNIVLGIIAGLAPCSFGWSIFLILFSLGKTAWIVPLLIALGIGIWLCLFVVLVSVLLLRNQIYAKVPKIAYHSSILSSSILLILSLYFFSLLF